MKLTNRKIWYLVLGLWAVVFVCMTVRNFLFDEEKIVDAFLENNYEAVTVSIEGFGQLSGSYLIEEERETLVKEAATILGITKPYYLESTSESGVERVELCKSSKNGTAKISFQVKTEEKNDLEQEARQYLDISLELNNTMDSAFAYGTLIEQTFDKYGIDGNVAVNYTGTIPGEQDMDARNLLADELLDKMSAKIVQEYRGEELFTVYGYTKMLDTYETVGGEKINVNIAISYDEVDNVTKIYLATPYIMGDY